MKTGIKIGVGVLVLVVVILAAVFLYKRREGPVAPSSEGTKNGVTSASPVYKLLTPDALILSQSLSQLPGDILTIPLLKDTLTEDFVFYYEQNERHLSLKGAIRRIAYEHQLSFSDEILAYVFNTPASLALWKARDGRLGHYMLFIDRGPLLKVLEAVAKIVLDDKQLTVAGELREPDGGGHTVYDLHYAQNQHLYFVDHADQLIVFSDADMLLSGEEEQQAVTRELLSSPHPVDGFLQRLKLTSLASKHTLIVSARYLSFGYQQLFPTIEALRFDYAPSGWSTLALTNGAMSDVRPLWEIAPTAPALCVALPLDSDRLTSLLRVITQEPQVQAALQSTQSVAAVCWYRQSRLYTPLAFIRTTGDPASWTRSLKTLFAQTIGGLEAGTKMTDTSSHQDEENSASPSSATDPAMSEATSPNDSEDAKDKSDDSSSADTTDSAAQVEEPPKPLVHYHPPFEVSEQPCTGGAIWRREVSSRHGLHPASDSVHSVEMRSDHYFVVTLAYCQHTILFSPDSTLVENAVAVLDKKYPPLADSFPVKPTASLVITPASLADLIKDSVDESLPSTQEPVFRASVSQQLLPLLERLKTYPGYTLSTPTGVGGWEPLTWDSFTTH